MCSLDLRGERRAVSSGKTLSSFVRSAVHVVGSYRARLPSLFNRRIFPTILPRSLLPFRSRFVSRVLRSTPCLAREESSFHLASNNNTHFYRPPLSAAFVLSTPPPCHFVFVPPQHALFRLSSFIRFTPVPTTFSTFLVISLPPPRVRFCFTDPLCPLSFSLRPPTSPRVSFQPHSLRRAFFLQPSFSHSISPPFPHALPPSLFHPLAVSHQLTHTLRRRQAPVPCGLVLRARGCCEIIVSPRPSRNQPPRVAPCRGKQQ